MESLRLSEKDQTRTDGVAWDEGREEQIECADPEAKGRERSWIWS